MISALILCKNEIETLPNLLVRLKGHCQQILVVDTGSTDGSLEVARVHAQVVQTKLNFDFGAARNFGLSYVNQPWVFQIDADEWPNETLLSWMNFQIPRSYASAYKIRRHNTIDGVPLDGGRDFEWHIRLFKSHLRYVGRIHEYIQVMQEAVEKAPQNCLLHHDKSSARQERQNAFYENWEEQRQLCSLRQSDKP